MTEGNGVDLSNISPNCEVNFWNLFFRWVSNIAKYPKSVGTIVR
jgi:hypothetical protein